MMTSLLGEARPPRLEPRHDDSSNFISRAKHNQHHHPADKRAHSRSSDTDIPAALEQ